jgi:2-hydroxychromene-2-carboxylate isomerase
MSGFAYLGMGALCSLAAKHNVDVTHRPIDIRKIFAAADVVAPAAQSAARLSWRETDMRLWALRRQLPLNVKPRHWPIDADLASCAIMAAQQAGLDGTALARSLLAAVWARDLDISVPGTIVALARELGMDGDMILAAAQDDATRRGYAQSTAQAIAAGVIGSPTIFVDDEMFFGQDRLDFVEDAIAKAATA